MKGKGTCTIDVGAESVQGKQLRESHAITKDKHGSWRLEMSPRDHPKRVIDHPISSYL